MKISDTTVGELYKSFDETTYKAFDKYLVKYHSTKRNGLVRLHQLLGEYRDKALLEQIETKELELQFLQKNEANYTLFMTYVNRLHCIIKEFVILSKIESKNLYTEVLWSEYLIENNLKRNLIINQSTFKLDNYKDQYPLQKRYFHSRERFFLTFIKSSRRTLEEIYSNCITMIGDFENYYQFQMIDNYKTLCGFFGSNKIRENKDMEKKLNALLSSGILSNNQIVKTNALMLAILVGEDDESYQSLRDIFYQESNLLSKEMATTISSSLINYTVSMQARKSSGYFSLESYNILNTLYNRDELFPTPAQAHIRLGVFITYELKHGNSQRAREILQKCIGSVSPHQRDSCEKLCLARIEFAEQNYEQARIYIDQGNTNDSLHYYPLFKTMLLKILIYLKDELRFGMERENLYKFLHKNKNLGEKNVQKYLKFYKYVDYMNDFKFQTLSIYMKDKLTKALSLESEQFHDKEWMCGRFEELEKITRKE